MGDATIVLEGANSMNGSQYFPCIYIPEDKTLTITGSGSLTAEGGAGAAIGGGYQTNCGNIVINDGTITTKSSFGAAIGGGQNGNCGNIVINGGTITATGGYASAGIGGGKGGNCGNITIAGGILTVSSYTINGHNDIDTPYSIGASGGGTCGTVTIILPDGEKEGPISEQPYIYGVDNVYGNFTVNVGVPNRYRIKNTALHGRKIIELNEDGSYKLGNWELLENLSLNPFSNQRFDLSRTYVELGLDFSTTNGTKWAYSGVFWTADQTADERVDSVVIDLGGTEDNPSITIKVNGREVFHDGNCSSHSQYSWGEHFVTL